MKTEIVAVVQARNSSTRLPRKAMALIKGEPMLELILRRVLTVESISSTYLATSRSPDDDPLEAIALKQGLSVLRGSLNDVASRFYRLARKHPGSLILRITGDNPLVDRGVISDLLYLAQNGEHDYVSNSVIRTFPYGLDVEVFRADVFVEAYRSGSFSKLEREHVTPCFYTTGASYRVAQLTQTPDLSNMRWTVDTQEDLNWVRAVFNLYPGSSLDVDQNVVLDMIAAGRVAARYMQNVG